MAHPLALILGFLVMMAGLLCCFFAALIFFDRPRDWATYVGTGFELVLGVPALVLAGFILRAAF